MTKHQKAIARGMFSPYQAAEEIGVCSKTILRWCKDGKLTAYQFTKNIIRIKPSDLKSFIEGHKV
jgi:excisionase family DNA binding protein